MRRHIIRSTTSVFGLIGLVALSAPAFAQADSDDASVSSEIVVTAQRRQERSVDVPISVTALGQETLATANVQDLSDISRVTPSLRFDTTGAFSQPTIRGIGTSITTSGGGANVGIYVDGFYSPNPLAADMQLLNVQSVQVLKGPQGTLFGRNTTGGAILIQTADPSEDTGGQFKASYGRFNELRLQGYATTAIAEGVAVDIEGSYRRGDGFVTNIIGNNDKVGKFESWNVRAGLKLDFGPASLVVRYQHGDVNDPTSLMSNTYVDPVFGEMKPGFVPDITRGILYTTDPDQVALDRPTFFRSKNDMVQATFKADLGFADLTSYSQYRGENVDASQNLDNTAAPIFQLGLPVKNDTWSQELLLNSKPGSALQWTGGLFYFSNRDTYFTYVDTTVSSRDPIGATRSGGSSTTTKSYAAFIDATYELSPQLFVTAGVRYAHDAVTNAYFNAGAPRTYVPNISSDRVTPRVVVRYKPSEESSIYASFTRGYKAALLDVGGTCQNLTNIPTPTNPTGAGRTCNDVKPETINAYEVGFKYDDRKLSLDFSAFYYDYKNLQVSLFLASQANIINAAQSKIYGLDGSIRYELFDGFQISAGGSWTHARYKDFGIAPVYVPCTAANSATLRCTPGLFGVQLTPLDDVSMQRVPEFTGNIGARYKTEIGGGEFVLSGNLYYTSKVNFGPSGVQFPQKAYEVASARAQWTDPSDTFTVAVWGDNLTNNRYLTAVQYNTIGLGANWSSPTTYGVEVGLKF
ncbi:TonB-dependent receptor [Novosphingobium sp. JCM 18896]|uniref:TonB-dependent receptor n=1 Tax=Novosphingobium sp. JCM 18896 TaxID=2989731 RepID=UPI00222219C2|nr:TonB-dependent receptor [Novosphingobium sp. JCM 18896]MCW1431197.1 TonB-dependent receptor [Novosphingobium sp. JCM 18896]